MKNRFLRALERLGLLRPAFRAYEGVRSTGRPRATRADDGLPVPPPRLIMRVAGTPNPGWFLEGGRLGAETISEALGRHGARLEDQGALLDFGCGCGRVTRRWAGLHDVAVHGSDSNLDAVEWCRQNLQFAHFETNGLAPPLVHPDGRFGLVYALSVFTHLTEQLQLEWIAELERVLRPGGYLLLTTHGERYRGKLTAPERGRFDAGELVVRWQREAGSNLCSAFHPPGYVQERLAERLELLEFAPEGAKGNPYQDLYLLRAP